DALEPFHPDRIAGRILGMGDVVSLVEKAIETVDANEAEEMARKFQKGQFDFNDLLSQMRQMDKMGGVQSLVKMLPGLGDIASKLDEAGFDNKVVKRQEAIILSMTKAERSNPEILNASRKRRIAEGCGMTVQDVNKLYKQLQQMQTMMKRMKKMGMGKMAGMMSGLMNSKDKEIMAERMQAQGLKGLPKGMPGLPGGGDFLGTNPFLKKK
ncbi:MAG TPA: signal recognition particle protein, partial [Flavisolibacter sp.]